MLPINILQQRIPSNGWKIIIYLKGETIKQRQYNNTDVVTCSVIFLWRKKRNSKSEWKLVPKSLLQLISILYQVKEIIPFSNLNLVNNKNKEKFKFSNWQWRYASIQSLNLVIYSCTHSLIYRRTVSYAPL